VVRCAEHETGSNAVSKPKAEGYSKKRLEDRNLPHCRENPRISRDEQCLQGTNIHCLSQLTDPQKLSGHKHRTGILTTARIIPQGPASKADTAGYSQSHAKISYFTVKHTYATK
jgi:hypothetical protein